MADISRMKTLELPWGFSGGEYDINRVVKLTEESLNKLTFAMTVPQLINKDYSLIKEYLTERELEKVKQVFKKYLPSEDLWLSKAKTHQIILSNLPSIKKIEEYYNTYSIKTQDIPQRDEYDFSNALLILYSNEEIVKLSEKYKLMISEGAHNFIQDLKFFFFNILDKLKMTPQEAETKEAYLRKLSLHHQDLKDEAHILEVQTVTQIKINKELLKDKLNQLLIIKDKINGIIKDCEEYIHEAGKEAEKQMIFDWKSSEYRQEVLEEKVNSQMIDLEFLRKKYLEKEKELRTKRFKTEQQLISFLDTYDRDMQHRQNDVNNQQETLRIENKVLNELQEKYKEQEITYNLLMEEKNDYENRLFKAKVHELKCSMAARKIQKFYRNFKKLANVAGKKDLLKSKKKRKKSP